MVQGVLCATSRPGITCIARKTARGAGCREQFAEMGATSASVRDMLGADSAGGLGSVQKMGICSPDFGFRPLSASVSRKQGALLNIYPAESTRLPAASYSSAGSPSLFHMFLFTHLNSPGGL